MENLLNVIYNAETSYGLGEDGRIDPRAYDTWNHGVRQRGNKPLTQMTVGEVHDLQRQNLRSKYTAAGAVQVTYTTLGELITNGQIARDMPFDARTQDQIAVTLLERRGLSAYQSGRMSAEAFGNNIAKEWASMPVLSNTYNHAGRPVSRGSAYYGGVLNNPGRSRVNADMVAGILDDPTITPQFSDYVDVNVPTNRARIEANNYGPSGRGPITVSWADPDYDIQSRTDAWMGNGEDTSQFSEPVMVDPLARVDLSRGAGSAPMVHGGWRQSFADGFADNNNIARSMGMSWAAAGFEREQGFSGVDTAQSAGYGGRDLGYFAQAKNQEHFDYLDRNHKTETRRRDRMAVADGWVADFAGAMVGTDTLMSMGVPVGAGYTTLRRGGAAFVRGMGKGGGAAGAFEVGAEMSRQRVNPNATFEEGLMRVGMASLMGGFIGGGTAAFTSARAAKALNELASEVNVARGTVGSTELRVGGRNYTVRADPSGGRVLAKGEAVPSPKQVEPPVRVVGGEVIVNEKAVIEGYRAQAKGGNGAFENATEYMEFLTREAAELDVIQRKMMKEGKGISLTSANKADDIEFDAASAAKTKAEGGTFQAGPSKGNLNASKIAGIPIDSKKIKSVEDMEKITKIADEVAAKARDQLEFEDIMRVELKKLGYRLDDVLPQEYKAKLQAAKVEASAKAEVSLEKWRKKNNKILENKKLEFISRMTDSPYKRVHRNALSGETRDLIDLLINDGAYARAADSKGATPGPSVYARRRRWLGVARQVMDQERVLYNKYLGFDDVKEVGDVDVRNMTAGKNTKRKDGSQAVTPLEWRNAVSKALITGQKTGVNEMDAMVRVLQNANEEYMQVARELGVLSNIGHLQKRIERLKGAMAQTDEIADEIAELQDAIKRQENGPSEDYFTRIYQQGEIRKNREAFKKNVVVPWMGQQPYMEVWTKGKDDLAAEIAELRANGGSKERIDALRLRKDKAPQHSKWEKVKASQKPEDISKRADELIAKILDEAEPDELNMLRDPNRPTFGRTRAFDIPNSHLLKEGPNGNGVADFIETDYATVQKVYAERMGPAIEMARTFARPVDGVSSKQGFAEALNAVKTREKIAWEKSKPRPEDMKFENEHPAHRAALDKMGLRDVHVKRMAKNDPQAQRIEAEGGKLNGYYDASTRTMYINEKAGIDTVYHEAFHAIFADAGLLKKLSYLRVANKTKRFEELLNVRERYQKDWDEMKAGGRIMPAEEEYIAKVFGHWSKRTDSKTMREFLDFANLHLKEKMGDDAPQIKLNDNEIDLLDKTFTRMRDKEDLDFEKHWSGIERDIKFSADRVLNRVARNPQRGDNRAAGVMKNWAMATFLGTSGLNAVQEIGMLVMRHGMKRTFRTAFGEMDTTTRAAFKANADELKAAGGMMDVLEGTAFAGVAELGLDPTRISPFEKTMRQLGNKMFVWSGLSPFTARLKEIDAAIQVHDFVETIDAIGMGGANAQQLAKLARFGISETDAKRMAKEPIFKTEDGHWQANTPAWGNEDLVTTFRAAIGSANENTILLASAADKPIIVDGTMFIRNNDLVNKYAEKNGLEDAGDFWRVHSGLLSLPFSFWNYALAATNKIVIAGLDEPSMKAASGVAAIVGLAYMNAAMRAGNDEWSEKGMDERLWRAIDQSGVLGVMPMFADKAQQASIGFTGQNPFPFAPKHGYNPTAFDAAMGLAGAGPQVVANAVEGGAQMLSGNSQGVNTASWSLPIIRGHIFTRDLMDGLVDGIERKMAGVDR